MTTHHPAARRPQRPRWTRVVLHPFVGVALLIAAGFYVPFVGRRAHVQGNDLLLAEWIEFTPTPVSRRSHTGSVGNVVRGPDGVTAILHRTRTHQTGLPPEVRLGSVSASAREARTGLWAPTRGSVHIDAQFTPRYPATPQGNSLAEFQGVIASIDEHLRAHPVLGRTVPGGLIGYIHTTGTPGVPLHDFSQQWSTRGAVLETRVLWWGYAENALVLLGLVWLILCAREAWITTPWRGLVRREWECWGCGYDLRSLDSREPCPECGRSSS